MRESSSFRTAVGLNRSISGQRATIAKICEEGKMFFLLSLSIFVVGKASRFPPIFKSRGPYFLFFLLSVGLERILKLLASEDIEVQMHALKVVANLAAEGNLSCS